MNRLAKEQKHTLAKEVSDSNEKYIFRIWLLSLGMAGAEFKTARRIPLAPLSGNAAFKDDAMEERWKEKQAVKREALKAAKAETDFAESEVSTDEADWTRMGKTACRPSGRSMASSTPTAGIASS